MRRLLLAALAVALVAPASATAADPIMPLADVRPGMQCTALSVVRGLEISSFGVEIVDVVDRGRAGVARIIVRVSGPAVDATGLGPGFSGSPIYCPGADGVARHIGAISETIGEYGGRLALATPIEFVLAQPVLPPPATRSVIGARSLAGPLTIGGLRPSLGRAFERAARRAGRSLIASPVSGSSADFPPQPLVPGAAVSVGLSSGDIVLGAIGTVTYTDGPSVWIFGHPLDGAGRRSLFLQDAYIHTVVSNPLAVPEVSTYKLGSPGNDVGTISSDGPNAVVGTIGALPASFPLRVTAKDLDTGRGAQRRDAARRRGRRRAADGRHGAGGSPPRRPSPRPRPRSSTARRPARAATCASRSRSASCARRCASATPTRSTAARRTRSPARRSPMSATPSACWRATASACCTRRRSRSACACAAGCARRSSTGVSGPAIARRGTTITLRLKLRRTGTGATTTRTVRMRVPLDAPTGLRALTLTGTPADAGGNPDEEGGDLSIVFEDENSADDDGGPGSLRELRARFDALARYTGVTARLGGDERALLRDPRLRISGQARLRLRIR